MPDVDADVVVVGGGLAGLAAARRLDRAGVDWVLVEAAGRVGGRVVTDVVDGFRLDRGFQVLNTAYPRLAALVDYDALEPRYLTPGVLVRRAGALHRLDHPLRRPGLVADTVKAPIGTIVDRTRLALLVAQYAARKPRRLLAQADVTTEQALRRAGLSPRIVEELARPFLSGVFADRSLETSSHVFAMVARSFARGRIAVPAAGMGALPTAVAAPLPPGRLRFGTPVAAVADDSVTLDDGTRLACRAVLVAADPTTAARLVPELGGPPRMRGLTTHYHATDLPPLDEATLVLDGDRREVVANTVVISRAAPSYAPPGRHLVSTSVVGVDGPPEPVVRDELARLYGVPTGGWEHVATVEIPDALPAAPPPQRDLRKPVRLGAGRYVAGDHRDSPSIQGALASGWRAAGEVLDALRGR
jgi:phytoene dehydrogenase-like protein